METNSLVLALSREKNRLKINGLRFSFWSSCVRLMCNSEEVETDRANNWALSSEVHSHTFVRWYFGHGSWVALWTLMSLHNHGLWLSGVVFFLVRRAITLLCGSFFQFIKQMLLDWQNRVCVKETTLTVTGCDTVLGLETGELSHHLSRLFFRAASINVRLASSLLKTTWFHWLEVKG